MKRKQVRRHSIDVCKECHIFYTMSSLGICFPCWEKKNEFAQWLILKKADKQDNPKDLK